MGFRERKMAFLEGERKDGWVELTGEKRDQRKNGAIGKGDSA